MSTTHTAKSRDARRPIRFEGDVAYVPLTQGYEAAVDATDVHLVDNFLWCARVARRKDGSIKVVYAARWGGYGRTVLMHRVIGCTPDGLDTDHIDGNGLNNRRKNLRSVTGTENRRNSRASANSKSGVKGVHWDAGRGKWIAQIKVAGKSHKLGAYACLDAAAAAYAEASKFHHGEFGRAE